MTEQEFKEKLHKESLTEDEKIVLCQWYIDKYPVLITNPLQGRFFSKLQGITIVRGGNSKLLDHAITKLKEYFKK
jgi:hypothetical protein